MLEAALHRDLHPSKRYLIAFSGGRDSSALLHAACSVRKVLEIEIEAAHVNHGLRAAADTDEEFARARCAHYGVPFHCHRASEAPTANIEAWGRSERYRFFGRLSEARAFDGVLTAHTADDVIETFLMRIGTNKELLSIEQRDPRRNLIRPFLEIFRRQIDDYLRIHAVPFVDDESNSDPKYLRNRIRATLVPAFEQVFEGDVREILRGQAVGVAQDLAILEDMLWEQLNDIHQYPFGSKEWVRGVRAVLGKRTRPLAARILIRALTPVLGFRLGKGAALRVVDFLLGNGAQIQLPGGWVIRRKDGGIIASRT